MVRRLVPPVAPDPPAPRLRAAGAEDSEFVRALSEEVFREFGDYGGFLPGYLSHPSVFTSILEATGERLGFVMIALVLSEDPLPHGVGLDGRPSLRGTGEERWLDAEILAIAVAPAQQAHGHGRRLIEHAIDFAESWTRSSGVRSLQLNVADTNHRAFAFFERHGFRVLAEDDGAYPKGQRSIRMVRALGGSGV